MKSSEMTISTSTAFQANTVKTNHQKTNMHNENPECPCYPAMMPTVSCLFNIFLTFSKPHSLVSTIFG